MQSTKAAIISAFLDNPLAFVSGADLGEQLNLSRVSIWNHLEQLKADGFMFNAIRNKGYRMEQEPTALHAELLQALLTHAPCPFFKSLRILDSIDSTNSSASDLLAAQEPAPLCVLAQQQTGGRGRRGRIWHSPPGRNLYLSIGLRPALSPARLQTITLWTGLRMAMFLRNSFALPVMVKWPNDLYVQDRKIAGILTEAKVDAEQTRELVIGIGLNVNIQPHELPDDLQSSASSLAIMKGHPLNASRLAHALLQILADALGDYFAGAYEDELCRLWPEFDYLNGHMVSADAITGRVQGITRTGSLRIQRPDGSIAVLHSGEVSLKRQ